MPTRSAEATWNGSLKNGEGSVALESGAFEGPYSFASRFESANETNPEELIGAAHAGCFAMALSLELGDAGYEPERLDAEAQVHLDPDALAITRVDLTVEGTVPDIDEDVFLDIAEGAGRVSGIESIGRDGYRPDRNTDQVNDTDTSAYRLRPHTSVIAVRPMDSIGTVRPPSEAQTTLHTPSVGR